MGRRERSVERGRCCGCTACTVAAQQKAPRPALRSATACRTWPGTSPVTASSWWKLSVTSSPSRRKSAGLAKQVPCTWRPAAAALGSADGRACVPAGRPPCSATCPGSFHFTPPHAPLHHQLLICLWVHAVHRVACSAPSRPAARVGRWEGGSSSSRSPPLTKPCTSLCPLCPSSPPHPTFCVQALEGPALQPNRLHLQQQRWASPICKRVLRRHAYN